MLYFNPELAITASALPFPPALMFILFPVWMAIVLFVLRYVSGWDVLMRAYRTQKRFSRTVSRFCSGYLNSAHFNNSLIVGADEQGLYLGMMFPFSLVFPSLLIPWEDVTAKSVKVFWSMYIEFRFRQTPSVALRIPEHLARKVGAINPIASDIS